MNDVTVTLFQSRDENYYGGTMTAPTNRDSDKFMLRLPDGMRERVRIEAEKNNRSMNAEVVARLDDSFVLTKKDDHFALVLDLSRVGEIDYESQLNRITELLFAKRLETSGAKDADEQGKNAGRSPGYPTKEALDRLHDAVNRSGLNPKSKKTG